MIDPTQTIDRGAEPCSVCGGRRDLAAHRSNLHPAFHLFVALTAEQKANQAAYEARVRDLVVRLQGEFVNLARDLDIARSHVDQATGDVKDLVRTLDELDRFSYAVQRVAGSIRADIR
jgi:hypothetical protein